jgi:hypothetical protein
MSSPRVAHNSCDMKGLVVSKVMRFKGWKLATYLDCGSGKVLSLYQRTDDEVFLTPEDGRCRVVKSW